MTLYDKLWVTDLLEDNSEAHRVSGTASGQPAQRWLPGLREKVTIISELTGVMQMPKTRVELEPGVPG